VKTDASKESGFGQSHIETKSNIFHPYIIRFLNRIRMRIAVHHPAPSGTVSGWYSSIARLLRRSPSVGHFLSHVENAVNVSSIEIGGSEHFGAHRTYHQHTQIKILVIEPIGQSPYKIRIRITYDIKVLKRSNHSVAVHVPKTHIPWNCSRKCRIPFDLVFVLIYTVYYVTINHSHRMTDSRYVCWIPLTT